MCHYYRKLHTCNCMSKVHLQMCHTGVITSTVCQPLPEPPNDPSQCRKSFFMCYDCIRNETRAELENKLRLKTAGEQERGTGEEARGKMSEQREGNEQVDVEAERMKKDGGSWIDAGSARRKGRRGGAGAGAGGASSRLNPPWSAPPVPGYSMSRKMGEFAREQQQQQPPNTTAEVDVGGRAGVWGRSSNVASKKSMGNNERNGWKK